MYDMWFKAAVSEQVSGVVLLDLSAAFEIVDSGLLLGKLEVYGIDNDGLQNSYLTDRHQAVWVDHHTWQLCPNVILIYQHTSFSEHFRPRSCLNLRLVKNEEKKYFLEAPSTSLLFEKYILDLSEKQGLTVLSAMYDFCLEKFEYPIKMIY